ncbi:MAG: hypothetical protein NW216_02420 [Hyphomicrobium sp.]|nr:hypothetical protein [Hyphomicrobium sp.]
MDRRRFLVSSFALAAAGPALAAEAGAPRFARPFLGSASTHLDFIVPAAEGSQDLGAVCRRLARWIEAASRGDLSLNLVDPREADPAEAISLQLACRQDRQHPAFAYFSGLPGALGLDLFDQGNWLTAGGGQALWDEISAAHGRKALLAGATATRPVLWSSRPLAERESFSGFRVTTFGLSVEVARGLGAEAYEVASAEEAPVGPVPFESAVECWGVDDEGRFVRPQTHNHGLISVFRRAPHLLSLDMPLTVWERLTRSQRCVLEAVAMHASGVRSIGIGGRGQAAGRGGAALAPPLLRHAVDRVAESVVAHVAARDDLSRRIDRSYMLWRGRTARARSAGTLPPLT